jgi:hypothetical protein
LLRTVSVFQFNIHGACVKRTLHIINQLKKEMTYNQHELGNLQHMRFLLILATFCLLCASGYLWCIYSGLPYAEIASLGAVAYFEYVPDGPSYLSLAVTPGRWALFQTFIRLLFGGSIASTAWLLTRKGYREELRALSGEARLASVALQRTLAQLTGLQLVIACVLQLIIFAVRMLWLQQDTLSPDEITSHDAFVREGAAAVGSFYPIPNNHVFYNFSSWLLAQVLPGQVREVMRLPSLLVATFGTVFTHLLLTHFRNFRVATLVTALSGLSTVMVIYAASGRGYYLQLVCIQLAFFAIVGLLTKPTYWRLGWAIFIVCSILGLYTIPTYAAPLASLVALLLTHSLWKAGRARTAIWGGLALATAIVLITAGLIVCACGSRVGLVAVAYKSVCEFQFVYQFLATRVGVCLRNK